MLQNVLNKRILMPYVLTFASVGSISIFRAPYTFSRGRINKSFYLVSILLIYERKGICVSLIFKRIVDFGYNGIPRQVSCLECCHSIKCLRINCGYSDCRSLKRKSLAKTPRLTLFGICS